MMQTRTAMAWPMYGKHRGSVRPTLAPQRWISTKMGRVTSLNTVKIRTHGSIQVGWRRCSVWSGYLALYAIVLWAVMGFCAAKRVRCSVQYGGQFTKLWSRSMCTFLARSESLCLV